MQSKFLPVTLSFLVWALAGGSAVAWGLQWSGRFLNAPRVASSTVGGDAAGAGQVNPSAVARMLGAVEAPTVAAVAPSTASRLVLLGVVSSRDAEAAALIAVDGKPPKPFVVGSVVIDSLVLQKVEPRRALLGAPGNEPASLTLDMPPRKDSKDSESARP